MDVGEVRYLADGDTMVATIAVPEGPGPHPVVLIGHEGPGLDDLQRDRARLIAELGYIGFAFDYHGSLSPFPSREAMMTRLGELAADPDRTRRLAVAALDAALAQPNADTSRVGAIGYCFGATVALELGRTGADIKAIVGFHPGLTNVRPADSARINGRVLMCIGADDPLIPLEHRTAFEDEMRAGGVDWQINLYGGAQHSFTYPDVTLAGIPGLAYHEAAALRSWAAMTELLGEVL